MPRGQKVGDRTAGNRRTAARPRPGRRSWPARRGSGCSPVPAGDSLNVSVPFPSSDGVGGSVPPNSSGTASRETGSNPGRRCNRTNRRRPPPAPPTRGRIARTRSCTSRMFLRDTCTSHVAGFEDLEVEVDTVQWAHRAREAIPVSRERIRVLDLCEGILCEIPNGVGRFDVRVHQVVRTPNRQRSFGRDPRQAFRRNRRHVTEPLGSANVHQGVVKDGHFADSHWVPLHLHFVGNATGRRRVHSPAVTGQFASPEGLRPIDGRRSDEVVHSTTFPDFPSEQRLIL